jgi:hypothetical protein
MPQDITESLQTAKVIIHNLLVTHQSTPELAVRYAIRQTELPFDVTEGLNKYASDIVKCHNVAR